MLRTANFGGQGGREASGVVAQVLHQQRQDDVLAAGLFGHPLYAYVHSFVHDHFMTVVKTQAEGHCRAALADPAAFQVPVVGLGGALTLGRGPGGRGTLRGPVGGSSSSSSSSSSSRVGSHGADAPHDQDEDDDVDNDVDGGDDAGDEGSHDKGHVLPCVARLYGDMAALGADLGWHGACAPRWAAADPELLDDVVGALTGALDLFADACEDHIDRLTDASQILYDAILGLAVVADRCMELLHVEGSLQCILVLFSGREGDDEGDEDDGGDGGGFAERGAGVGDDKDADDHGLSAVEAAIPAGAAALASADAPRTDRLASHLRVLEETIRRHCGAAEWRAMSVSLRDGVSAAVHFYAQRTAAAPDVTRAGSGQFDCVAEGASPGIMQPYRANPRWFSYGGDTPAFIKSYYVKAGGITRQPIDWVAKNVYQKMVDRGYNHHMSSGFLPVLPLRALWDGQPLTDGPEALNHTIFTDPASPSTSMQLDVWHCLEDHLGWLNDHDISVDFFQGFSSQGPDSGRLNFGAMNETTKRWWVSYVVARLSPFANIFGFVYSWETGGKGDDLHLAQLLHEFDIFRHQVTYEDANALALNWYNLSAWDFASVEVYGGVDAHHNMTLAAFRGKPVYFTEAHLLWRSFWFAAEASIPSTAWAITTAGGSWTWNDMGDARIIGPYRANQAFNTYPIAVKAVDIIADIMVNKTAGFAKLVPADHLLTAAGSRPPPALTYCLAEPGSQYLVYSDSGQEFELDLSTVSATVDFIVTWHDAVDDQHVVKMPQNVTGGAVVKLTPPSTSNHWIGLLLH
eukprot:g4362.t1